LDQSQALTLWINGDYITVNIGAPGFLSSGVDFGYNNQCIIFNETNHSVTYNEPKVDALWMFWRAVLAEQFATSIDLMGLYTIECIYQVNPIINYLIIRMRQRKNLAEIGSDSELYRYLKVSRQSLLHVTRGIFGNS